MAGEWYVAQGGRHVGPFAEAEVRQQVASGVIGPETLVWHDGLSNWMPARTVPGLLDGSAAAPPAPVALSLSAAAAPAPIVGYAGLNMDGMSMTPRALDLLRQTKPWARVVSIVLMVAAGLLVIGGFFWLVGSMNHGIESLAIIGLIYLAMAALTIAPAIFLSRYASRIGTLLVSRREQDLEEAMEAQKSFWKFTGVMTLIVIGIYAIMFLSIFAMFGRW